MGEVLVKLAAHYSMSLIEEHLLKLFPRIQYGVKRPGGSESAAQLVRAALDESTRTHPGSVALALDFMNAFNASSRSKAWERMLSTPETESTWRMFHWRLRPAAVRPLHTALRTAVAGRRAAGLPLCCIRICTAGAASV